MSNRGFFNHKNQNIERKAQLYRRYYISLAVISVVLLIFCALLVYQVYYYRSHYVNREFADTDTNNEKENLIKYLNNIENTYAELIYEYEGLDSILSEEKKRVIVLKEEINTLRGNSSEYKDKVIALEGRLKEYMIQIEDLKIKNEALVSENLQVKIELNNALEEKGKLIKKVEESAVLRAYEIVASGVRYKSEVEIPTQSAKQTKKIKTCFTLAENSLIAKGNKSIYIRIFDPTGKVLTQGAETFEFEGRNYPYSMKRELYYDNAQVNVCLYWEKSSIYEKGSYNVFIFADNKMIGSSYFTLE